MHFVAYDMISGVSGVRIDMAMLVPFKDANNGCPFCWVMNRYMGTDMAGCTAAPSVAMTD